MRNGECIRETVVLEALRSARWPGDCEQELRDHVSACESCAEMIDLAEALLDDHRALVAEAQVPSSAIVWWRAQMRSRREATQVAAQPIAFVYGLIVACIAGVTVAAAGFFSPTFRQSLAWMAGLIGSAPQLSLSLPADPQTSPFFIAVAAALVLCAIVLPLALYFTFQAEE